MIDPYMINERQNEKSNLLSLLDSQNILKMFEYIPRNFEINTNNGSCYFNTSLIRIVSETISNYLENHPDSNQYHLSLENNNVLKKIEEIFQGKVTVFKRKELSEYRDIIEMLQLSNYIFDFNSNDLNYKRGITNSPNSQGFFLNNSQTMLKISTLNNVYECDQNGICSSKVLRDFIASNPGSDLYVYNYEDEFEEFQKICDFFNFKEISITAFDFDYLTKIAEDLKIDIILDKINCITKAQEKIVKKIDEYQELVDPISELFEWLHQIDQLSAEKVKKLIIESNWSKTEEDVQELAAFIIQAIKSNERLHKNLIELLIQLDLEDSKELKILLPFLKEKLMISFQENKNSCSFVHKLYCKGIIQKEEIFSKIKKCMENRWNQTNFLTWFLPEIIEYDESYLEKISKNSSYRHFLPDKIDLYRQMRDSGDPNDEIAKALKNDDIDAFQSILSKMQIKDISKCYICPSIFESFENNVSYLDYSAIYGSIKCFKYLMLNHSKITQKTFYYSIYGGNIEIIKIADNYLGSTKDKHNYDDDEYNYNGWSHLQNGSKPDIYRVLIYLIENHKNDLLDWFMEQKMTKYGFVSGKLSKIITSMITSCNAHAVITFIDKGFNIFAIMDKREMTSLAASNGFNIFYQFLYNIGKQYKEKSSTWGSPASTPYISFGNLSIFKFYITTLKNDSDVDRALVEAIEKNQTKMVDYYFNKLSDKISVSTISSVLPVSLAKSTELFYSFTDRFQATAPLIYQKFHWNLPLLEVACKYGQIKPFHTIIDSIKIQSETDFTKCIFGAAISDSMEICNYLIDHKYYINYLSLFQQIARNPSISMEIILLLFNNSSLELENGVFNPLLYPAIKSHNKNFVEFLCERNIFYDEILIDAVTELDINIVNIILKYKSNSYFINRGSLNGTALHIAVRKNNLEIVKKLLENPSINPFLYDNNGKTPLIIASEQLFLPIINELILPYSKNIVSHADSIEFLLNSLLKLVNSSEKESISKGIKMIDMILDFDDISLVMSEKNTKSILSCCFSKYSNKQIIQKLIKIESIDINERLSNGETPLTSAIKEENQDIIELLINLPRININKINSNGDSPLLVAAKKYNLETVKKLLSISSLHSHEIERLLEYLLASLPNMPKNYSNNNPFTWGSSYYSTNKNSYWNNKEKISENINSMLEMVLNIPNIEKIFIDKNKQIILKICSKQSIDIKLIQMILKINTVDINICSPSDGNTPLTLSLNSKRADIAELLLKDPRIDVNITNFNHESALTIAAKKQQTSIVKLLVNHEKFDPELSHADYAFTISNDEVSDILLSLNLFDVNCVPTDLKLNKNMYCSWGSGYQLSSNNDTILILAAKSKNLKKIEQILKHPTFDKDKSNLSKAANLLFTSNNKTIVNEFFKILYDNGLINYCTQNKNIFNDIMPYLSDENLLSILNDCHDDSATLNDYIIRMFIGSLKLIDESVDKLSFLLNYDKKHDNILDFKNKSYFTKIKSQLYGDSIENALNIVNFIVENGGDVNQADENGIYPLEYAIGIENIGLVSALLKTNKVNYHQIITKTHYYRCWGAANSINYWRTTENNNNGWGTTENNKDTMSVNHSETYLHMAARSNRKVLQLILQTNAFDINAKNSDNETPLMIACQHRNKKNIKLLFANDNIDFLCKNNNNEDALEIVQNMNRNKKEMEVEDKKESNDKLSKDKYLAKLIETLHHHKKNRFISQIHHIHLFDENDEYDENDENGEYDENDENDENGEYDENDENSENGEYDERITVPRKSLIIV